MSKQTNKKEFQKIVESASLSGVSLISSKFECRVPTLFIRPRQTALEFKKAIRPFVHQLPGKNSGALHSHIYFAVIGTSKKDIKALDMKKGSQLFSISVSYIAGYRFKNMSRLDTGMLEFFGKENGFFNVYPYLREFIHHTSLRLNIPPVIIPLLKPVGDLPPGEDKN